MRHDQQHSGRQRANGSSPTRSGHYFTSLATRAVGLAPLTLKCITPFCPATGMTADDLAPAALIDEATTDHS